MICKRLILRSFSAAVSPAVPHSLSNLRNIGISAHVDSGKTTLTERILFYTGRIAAIHDIQGKDGVGCKMDHMDLERERGITITSAATSVQWIVSNNPFDLNIIDTPGHVDFTIEVERALRVLDGAVMVVCGVNGVQSQTVTVDRQMRRYSVPRLLFVNKLDRRGSDVFRVMSHLRQKLSLNFAPIQIPIGTDHDLQGVIDLVTMRAEYFLGPNGDQRVFKDIPSDLHNQAHEYRAALVERIAEIDDEVGSVWLEGGDVSADLLSSGIRRATLSLQFCPLLMGSAYKNKGVQSLLDAVCAYLPSPAERLITALDTSNDEQAVQLHAEALKPFVGMAFKVQEMPGAGQVTYVRVYQGRVRKADTLVDTKKDKRVCPKRVLRMHANEVKELPNGGGPGDIVGLTGLDVDSGTTLTDGRVPYVLTSMFVPEPVMSLSLKMSAKSGEGEKFSKALNRFQKEDPTFRVAFDSESKETIISGMGELHLEIYAERMRREYGLPVETGAPAVNFRETVTGRSEFNYTFKRQTGGRGLFGRVIGYMEPLVSEGLPNGTEVGVEFVNKLYGNSIPPNFIPSIEKGFKEAALSGCLTGHPCLGLRIVLTDGLSHEVDSNDLSFKLAAKGAFEQAFPLAAPVVLEPVMRVQAVAPIENQAAVLTTITGRRGCIVSNAPVGPETQLIEADVPLRCMFGYTSELRAVTQGHGEFSMDFLDYQIMPGKVQQELEDKHKLKLSKRKLED